MLTTIITAGLRINPHRPTVKLRSHISPDCSQGTQPGPLYRLELSIIHVNVQQFITTFCAIKDSPPSLPKHVRLIIASRFAVSERSSLLISVAIVPGSTAFARMLYFPNATAQLCMRDNMPAFVGV